MWMNARERLVLRRKMKSFLRSTVESVSSKCEDIIIEQPPSAFLCADGRRHRPPTHSHSHYTHGENPHLLVWTPGHATGVRVQVGHEGGRFQTRHHLVLCKLCKNVKGSDREVEFSRMCEFADLCSEGLQLVPGHLCMTMQVGTRYSLEADPDAVHCVLMMMMMIMMVMMVMIRVAGRSCAVGVSIGTVSGRST